MPIIEGLQNWVRDSAIQGAVDDVQNPGERNANMMSRFAGMFTGVDVDKAVDDHTQKVKNKEVTDYLTGIGETRESLNLTPDADINQASGAYNRVTRQRSDTKDAETFSRSLALPTMQMAQSANQFNATMQRQMANDAKSHQLQLMQLADAQDQRAMEFEYQKSRDRKADQQYNERMEQLDRKDRRQGISSLAAGLAALGAAFAA